jgi:lipopolysaccharide biosynthesis glycosyltransferase
MIIFTSITLNYLPKAKILAASIKRFHPTWKFHLLINDRLVTNENKNVNDLLDNNLFNQIIWLDELRIENKLTWIFKHTVVELCTAVKGFYLQELMEKGFDKIVYIDPDIVLFNKLSLVEQLLDDHAILLTPHLLEFSDDTQAIMDNEIAGTLKHGTFNLGFIAVNAKRSEGKLFINWWAKRCLEYCYADYERGLFTDQKWCDLVPSFFEDYYIIRDPGYDVASWNLDKRVLSMSEDGNVVINDKSPLRFYHFTGYDSGAGSVMTDRYSQGNSIVNELWDWYKRELEENGQAVWGSMKCFYDSYENGEEIPKAARVLYRNREDLMRAFPDPYRVDDQGGYWGWKGK